MQRLMEMRRKRTALRQKADAILKQAEIENRELDHSERATCDSLLAQIKTMVLEEDRYIAEKHLEEELRAPQVHVGAHGYEVETQASAISGPATDRSYRGMFHPGDGRATLSRGGFENFNEFLSILASGRHDPRLGTRAMLEGTPSAGGFAVPEEFAAWLLDHSLENEIVRPRATVWPMTAQTMSAPGWDGSNHTSTLFGGFSGGWLAEGGTASRETPKLRRITLTARKLAIFSQMSRELAQDGLTMEAQLSAAMIEAASFFLDEAFLRGDGVGKPLGVMNSPSLVTVPKETGQAADTLVYENILHMFARLHPSCQKNAVWLVSATTFPSLMTMSVAVGTGGAHIPIVQSSNNQFSMLAKPIIFTEKMATIGDLGDILLVDLSKYAIGMRQEVLLDKSNAPGWTEDLTDYRAVVRCDGQAMWNAAVSPKAGDTLSWAVTLAAR